MKIEILGTGCSKCEALFNNAKQAAGKAGYAFSQIEKVEDLQKIMEYGVMSPPDWSSTAKSKARARCSAWMRSSP